MPMDLININEIIGACLAAFAGISVAWFSIIISNWNNDQKAKYLYYFNRMKNEYLDDLDKYLSILDSQCDSSIIFSILEHLYAWKKNQVDYFGDNKIRNIFKPLLDCETLENLFNEFNTISSQKDIDYNSFRNYVPKLRHLIIELKNNIKDHVKAYSYKLSEYNQ